MTPLEDWQYITARLKTLIEAQRAVQGQDHWAASQGWVIPALKTLVNDLKEFATHQQEHISPKAIEAIRNGVNKIDNKVAASQQEVHTPAHSRAAGLIAALLTIESEVSYYLQDFDHLAKPVVERAFLHLQRLLTVDSSLAKQWQTAFKNGGETACEKLGAVHLLHHGIYAFKANAEGGRTDLALGERLAITSSLRQVATALVLTEWKVAKSPADVERKFEDARVQAKMYGDSILQGFELGAYRYLVVVSEKAVATPEDVSEGPVTYRHIQIALSPATPSVAARRRPRN